MISSLNVICFQMMMTFKVPVNVKFFFGILLTFINADLLDPQWTTSLVFDYEPDIIFVEEAFDNSQPLILTREIYEQGFETFNPILNLGGLFVIITYVVIKMVVLLLLKISMRFF